MSLIFYNPYPYFTYSVVPFGALNVIAEQYSLVTPPPTSSNTTVIQYSYTTNSSLTANTLSSNNPNVSVSGTSFTTTAATTATLYVYLSAYNSVQNAYSFSFGLSNGALSGAVSILPTPTGNSSLTLTSSLNSGNYSFSVTSPFSLPQGFDFTAYLVLQ